MWQSRWTLITTSSLDMLYICKRCFRECEKGFNLESKARETRGKVSALLSARVMQRVATDSDPEDISYSPKRPRIDGRPARRTLSFHPTTSTSEETTYAGCCQGRTQVLLFGGGARNIKKKSFIFIINAKFENTSRCVSIRWYNINIFFVIFRDHNHWKFYWILFWNRYKVSTREHQKQSLKRYWYIQ